jgi:hypothetical protein
MAKPIGRVVGWAMPGLWAALLTAGCSRVHENERAIIESTPKSEPAPYAVSREAYRDHMQDRFKNMSTKTYGKQTPSPRKAKK